ncbi:MAG TPA: DoxX family protein [Puia sp.]|nr:DoxX family protein [Puia sp.]
MEQPPVLNPTISNTAQTPVIGWSLPKQVAFRFFFIFFLLYMFFNPNGVIPFSETISSWYLQAFHTLIPWIGKHILHLASPITIFTNGSGDTTYDYVTLLFIFVLALAGCAIWSGFDRHHHAYPKLYYWLTFCLRYYVAITMLSYGLYKVIKLQFPFPGLASLLEPYGRSSPMGLAWNFMGYSDGYNYFAGFAEITAGVLLLFRRTMVPGALLAFVVCANIMAMNYCFDIPVKLLSTMLVLMSLYLLSDNFSTIAGFLFMRRQTALKPAPSPAFRKKTVRILAVIGKSLFIAFVLVTSTIQLMEARTSYGDAAPHISLRGIYDVRTFIRNKETLPALTTDTFRWKQLVIDGSPTYSYASIRGINDSSRGYFSLKMDTVHHTMTLSSYRDTSDKYSFIYRLPKNDSLILSGAVKKDSLEIRLKLFDWKDFLLVRRGFHWINEYPMNR